MPFRLFLIVFALLGAVKQSLAQHVLLTDSIRLLSQPANGTVGVAVMNFSSQDTLSVNGTVHFPMQSVMKFPLAIAVLHQVDERRLRLEQKIHLSKEDLSIRVSSPIQNKYPDGNIDITLAELLSYTVSQSDNNGCDKLFQLMGGPGAVNNYIHSLGVKNIAIVATEKQMGQNWQTQYTNWCTPNAMVQLLYLFNRGNVLSPKSRNVLWKMMVETVNAPQRIKGLLPQGTLLAHKPGTSWTNSQGITAATNDVGIIELPNKQRFAIAVFVSDATAGTKTREETIARIAKLVWDHPLK